MKGMEENWGRYTVSRVLGRGVYGEVRLGQSSGESFAIKRFFSVGQGLDSPDEIAIALQASHPHIIKALEYFYQGKQDYLVMELADTNLQSYLFSGFLTNKDKVRLFYELVSAVAYLQENGFYHCDIKPVNVLIKDDQVKLGDLGLSKYKSVTRNSCQSYASPQSIILNYQASAISVKVDQRLRDVFYETSNNFSNDVWALGITLVFILTGRVLFYDTDSAQEVLDNMQAYIRNPKDYLLQNGVSDKWLSLVLQMLEPSANLRLPLARDILLQAEFVKRGLYQPIPGYAAVFYDLPLSNSLNLNFNIAALLAWMEEIITYIGGNAFVLHASVTCLYYMLSLSDYSKDRAQLLAAACIGLMNTVYSVYSVDPYDLIYRPNTKEQLFTEERSILQALRGRLYFTILPKLAFSKKAIEKSNTLLLDTPAYLTTDLHAYMNSLLEEETIEERNHRWP
jgi:serine/threonine protein kinase